MTELVTALGRSPERLNLLFKLIAYRSFLASLGYNSGFQFIDGSFVEDIETLESRDPQDIDVVSWLIRPIAYQSDPLAWRTRGYPEWEGEIVNWRLNKVRYSLDTYGVTLDDVTAIDLMQATVYWYSLFSHRRLTHDWKGFVVLPLDASDDQSALSAIVTGP